MRDFLKCCTRNSKFLSMGPGSQVRVPYQGSIQVEVPEYGSRFPSTEMGWPNIVDSYGTNSLSELQMKIPGFFWIPEFSWKLDGLELVYIWVTLNMYLTSFKRLKNHQESKGYQQVMDNFSNTFTFFPFFGCCNFSSNVEKSHFNFKT